MPPWDLWFGLGIFKRDVIIMLLFTRMGWLVPCLWLAAVCIASQVPAQLLSEYVPQLSRVTFIFFLAAIISTPLVLISGLLLNREKVPRTLIRYGKERTVNWGTHTFYTLPMEYWAWFIPIFTMLAWAICSFI